MLDFIPVNSVRHTCYACVEKHLGSAAVLAGELDNYPEHAMLVVGHLHEAEQEIRSEEPDTAEYIRDIRHEFQATGELDFDELSSVFYMDSAGYIRKK